MEILQKLPETEQADVDRFLARHADIIRREAKRYARSAEEADDIEQDAMLRILCAAGVTASVRNSTAWVRTIVHNAAMDHLSKTRLHQPLEAATGVPEAGPSANPERTVLARCILREIFCKISAMSNAEHEIIAGIAAGQSETEIAERLGKSKNAVYLCLHRLRKVLAAGGHLEN